MATSAVRTQPSGDHLDGYLELGAMKCAVCGVATVAARGKLGDKKEGSHICTPLKAEDPPSAALADTADH